MIKKSKQSWEVGQIVNVGFVKELVVLAAIPTPGDSAPDAYILRKHEQLYKFVPHQGIQKIIIDEARELIASAKRHADKLASSAVAKAAEAARINDLIFSE